jgi:Spy/CpxP family protein refolding chaperone
MKKLAPWLVVLSVGLNLAFVGVWVGRAVACRRAQDYPCGHAGKRDGISCPLHRALGASPEQWKQIEPRLAAFQKAAREACLEVGRRRAELIDLLAASPADRQAVTAKQEEILAGQRRVQQLVIDHLLAEKELLTPQQQKQLFDLLRERGGCPAHGPMMMNFGEDEIARQGGTD